MMFIIREIANSMIREARLPDGWAGFQAIRKSSFDELHRAFQGNFTCRREQRVDVVGHGDEFVEQESSLVAVMREGVDQEVGGCLVAEDRLALGGDGSDEEHAVAVHLVIVAGSGEYCL